MKISLFGRKAGDAETGCPAQPVRSRGLSNLVASHYAAPTSSPGGGEDIAAGIIVQAARQQPIVFRQLFPPPSDPGMSFYGGAPVGPTHMTWPRSDVDGLPLTFIMQWDASALAAHDPTGVIPRSGVLYLFSTLAWRDRIETRFLYMPADGQDWTALRVPDALPPVLDHEGAWRTPLTSPDGSAGQQVGPQLLPRWPFQPIALDYPPSAGDDSEEALYWHESAAVKKALLRAQDPDAKPQPAAQVANIRFERPFSAFPHDWTAVRVVAVAALAKLACTSPRFWKQYRPEADAATQEALAAEWRAVAVSLFEQAVNHAPSMAVPHHIADLLWQRMEVLEPCLELGFDRTVREAVNQSLGLGSEASEAIPADRVQALAEAHSLATVRYRDEYEQEFRQRLRRELPIKEDSSVAASFKLAKNDGALRTIRDIWAPTPNRMFGPPSDVQGAVEEFVGDWLLLLELGSSESIGMPLGEGVFQFLIRPQDLADLRFDRVKTIATAY